MTKMYTPHDTQALDYFIREFKVKYNPAIYEDNYAKFLEIVGSMLDSFRTEFEEKFVEDMEEPMADNKGAYDK